MAVDRPIAERASPGAGRTPLSPDLIAQRGFSVARRGFDQTEVRAFLAQVSEEVQALRARIDELDRLRQEAEHHAAHPVLDEETLMEAVGEETATILRAARATAADMRQRVQEQVTQIADEAEQAAAKSQAEAEEMLATSAEEAEQHANEVLAQARSEADEIRAQAERERRMTVEAAQAVREKILADLSRRRRVASVQIEQLRAGRQRLLESYGLVRRTLEEVHSDLQRADAEARLAADDAGRRAEHELPQPSVASTTEPVTEDADTVGVLPWRPSDEAQAATAPAPPQPAAAPESGKAASAASWPTEAVAVDELFEPTEAGRQEEGAPARGRSEEPGAMPEPEEDRRPDADEALLQERDRAVLDIEVSLTRKLKRALQDDQNSLLDQLRNLRGAPTAARVLPDEAEYRSRLADTGRPLLLEAAAAGAAFAAKQCKEQGIPAGEGEAQEAAASAAELDVTDLVDELVGGITDPLRRRVEEAITSSGEDHTTLVDTLGAAYREWKSQRIEASATDVVAAAFSRGSWATVPEGTRLRWLPDDVDGPCPDCDDDSLAGALPKGEAWPTGQLYPPAHSGCRCLLVPVAG